MVKKIEYENKISIQNDESIADKNKVTDNDMNEIKEVVNNNADELVLNQQKIKQNADNIELLNNSIGDINTILDQINGEII